MEEMIVALAVTLPILGLFVMIIYLRRIENSERLAMIDKGVDPSLFTKKPKGGSSSTLRISLLLVGIGVGFLGGQIWEELFNTGFRMGNPLPYFTMIFIFGGLGLLTAYLVEEKKNKHGQQ
jgi:hypothetical protein